MRRLVTIVIAGLGILASACSGSSKGSSREECVPGTAQCGALECIPNTKFCKDSSVWKCGPGGDNSWLTEVCTGSNTCRMDDTTAECVQKVCDPGARLCDGTRATKCKADGLGVEAGDDCAEAKQVCVDGRCVKPTCTPNERLCQGGDVYLCSANGTSMSLLADCGPDPCDGNLGVCRPKVCESGDLTCEGTSIATCNEYGTGWDPTEDCADEGLICVDAACETQVCVPNSSFCQDGNVHQCNETGTDESLAHECDPKLTRCEDFPQYHFAQCNYYPCPPNQPICDGQWARVCTANGEVPPSGIRCSGTTTCRDGACRPIVCAPTEVFCQDRNVWSCNEDGTESFLAQQCGNDQACQPDDHNSGASCQSTPCAPGASTCIGNQIGTCDETGMTVSTVTSDCAAAGNVCTAAGACAKTAVDALGEGPELLLAEAGTALGNLFKVMSSRRLTNLEVSLVLTAPHDLRFVIFEEQDYEFHARVDTVVANQQGTDYFSSGPLNYPLQAGRRYFLAVTSTTPFGAVYDRAPWNAAVSFGATQGGVTLGYEPTIWGIGRGEDLFHMRITTELPE